MAFIPFQKSNKCLVTEDVFVEITWEEGKSPEDDSELQGIIEEIDQQYLDRFQHPIEESLPYVTFLQAELLFKALQIAYGQFRLNKVSVCHLEGREAVSEGEVFASPFIINGQYQDLLQPLIQSILSNSEFNQYTYLEKREYFINQIYPEYKSSVGINESALPLFPEKGEKILADSLPHTHATNVSFTLPKQLSKAPSQKKKQTISLKKVYLLIGVAVVLAVGGILSSVYSIAKLSKQSDQVTYLYHELKSTQALVANEHSVDVFGRYFLPNYYSGKKENLVDFLSDGDAKYTVPKKGLLQSVILEKLTYDAQAKEYAVTYVLSIKNEDQTSSTRIHFTVKESDDAEYGFVVTTEPAESAYK